jgi:alpha-amylase
VQGISTNFFLDLLNQGPLAGKFAVGEYWNGSVPRVNGWATSAQWMGGRAGVLDFPLYFTLLAMSNDPSFDMGSLDHAGVAGVNPFHAVTFVENHDTESRRDLVPKNIQPEDKPLAYAYILTSEGFPCVFYKDYSTDPECLGGRLQPVLDNLIWIHQNIAEGSTRQRWKDGGVFVFERLGGSHLLVALNKDKTAGRSIQNIATGFPPNTRLHDYTGHAEDIVTDGSGHVALNIPRNLNGLGYVCYSVPGIANTFTTTPSPVTQVFEGASDLDIKPADTRVTARVFRIWVAALTQIGASLTFDASSWSTTTRIMLTLDDAAGNQPATGTYDSASSGQSLVANAAAEGWYVFNILAQDTPASNPRLAFTLTVSYQAPQVPAAL